MPGNTPETRAVRTGIVNRLGGSRPPHDQRRPGLFRRECAQADIVARATSVFGPGGPPRSQGERRTALEPVRAETESLLDTLDSRFYAYPDDISALVERFLLGTGDAGLPRQERARCSRTPMSTRRLLCLHASRSRGAQWRRLSDALGEDWDVAMPDLLGYSAATARADWSGFRMEDELTHIEAGFDRNEPFHKD